MQHQFQIAYFFGQCSNFFRIVVDFVRQGANTFRVEAVIGFIETIEEMTILANVFAFLIVRREVCVGRCVRCIWCIWCVRRQIGRFEQFPLLAHLIGGHENVFG